MEGNAVKIIIRIRNFSSSREMDPVTITLDPGSIYTYFDTEFWSPKGNAVRFTTRIRTIFFPYLITLDPGSVYTYFDTAKSEFWSPNGTGVRRHNITNRNA